MIKSPLTASNLYIRIPYKGYISNTLQIDENAINIARLITASLSRPIFRVSTHADMIAFLEDDGGY